MERLDETGSSADVGINLPNVGDSSVSEDTRRSISVVSTTSRSSTCSSHHSSLTGSIPNAEISSRIRVSHSERSQNSICVRQTFSMNKLRFSSLGLHGRKKEVEELQVCFDRLAVAASESAQLEGSDICTDQRKNTNEVVFISGESGTGKTALADSIQSRVDRRKGIYIGGKFDLYLREPYFGIVAAFRELCTKLLLLKTSDSVKYRNLCDNIVTEVGEEIALLVNICPDLEEALGIPIIVDSNACKVNKEAKERLKYAFVQFFRAITSHINHFVLVIDDLQWADVASMELLDALIKDKGVSLMFIGIYRSNEVDNAHYLSKTIRDLHEAKESGIFKLTEVSLGNLDLATCEDILVELLSVDPSDKTHCLAELIHKRTFGNVFHMLAYLDMLQEEQLIQFNLGSFKWTWNSNEIETVTLATSNVVELIGGKMSKLQPNIRSMLKLASCLGQSFEKALLLRAFSMLHDDTDVEGENEDLLAMIVEESFLEPQGPSSLRFCWIHDSIQAAAYSLASEEEMPKFQLQLGLSLLQNMAEEDLENNLFVIVNLINAAECPESDKLMVAGLNLKAAKKAVVFSAYESCVIYAEQGVALLPADRWSQEQKLSIDIYSICTEAHFSLGNIGQMNFYGDELLQQESVAELEKVRVYHCKICALGGGGNSKEALALCLKVLGRLGCHFPRNICGQVAKAISSISSTKLPKDDILSTLLPMTDETKKACMLLMTNAATYAHYCDNPFAMIMTVTRMVRWTTKHGLDSMSAAAFSLFGLVKVKLNAYEDGARFADLGQKLINNAKDKTPESRVTYITWFMVLPRSKPIHSTLRHLLRGYKLGMEVGDAESVMWNVSMYICASIVAGKSLNALAVDCATYLEQMRTLKQDEIYYCSLPFYQFALNMMGDSKDPLLLTGSAMNEQDHLITIDQMSVICHHHYQIFKSFLCTFFGDWETGAKLALERGDAYEKKNGAPLVMLDFLHQGIALFAMARKTRKKKYYKKAKKVSSTVSFWVKKGNVNVKHYVPLLEAEEAAYKRKPDDALRLYRQAITMAARSGFQHNAALASERLGEYMFHDLNQKERAKPHFSDAAKYYSGWGSPLKAQLIEEKYAADRRTSIRVKSSILKDAQLVEAWDVGSLSD